jgi:hypothetical protein
MKTFNLPTSILKGNPDILKEAQNSKISFIEIDEILENDLNLYTVRNVEGYAQSIMETGIHEPLTVMKRPEGYVLLAGHSRLAALKQLVAEGYRYSYCEQDITGKAPVIIRPEFSDKTDELKALIASNYQRELTAKDKADLIDACLDIIRSDKKNDKKIKGRMAHQIAAMIPVPEFYIKNYLAKNAKQETDQGEEQSIQDERRKYSKVFMQMKRLTESMRDYDWRTSDVDTKALIQMSEELKKLLEERIKDYE